MTYTELKKEAKALGINPVGITKEDLEKKIEEAKASEPESENQSEPQTETEEFNTAIVYNGTSEVRRYTVQEHGESFSDLADEFSKKHNYTVKLVTLE